jgi:hypothetical protein
MRTGRQVAPWEIRPGRLIRLRGVMPHTDSLNATARNGITVFRVKSVEFNAADYTAHLELDAFAPSIVRALAVLKKNHPTQQRRR